MDPLQNAEAELERLTRERDEIEAKIAVIRQTIEILGPVYADQRTEGMTERIRQALMAKPDVGISPKVVRMHLEQGGFDLSGYSNPMATIHTILKRLVSDDGQFRSMPTPDGAAVYIYDPSIPPGGNWKKKKKK
jgi:hypothetical protein